jgi:hypothetical protein
MRILTFQINNYRSCLLTSFSPNPGLTALIGINGSGKSNLLSAMLLLKRSSGLLRRYRYPDQTYVNRSRIIATIQFQRKPVRLKGEIYYVTNDRNIDEVVGTKLSWNLERISGEKGWVELPNEMLAHGEDIPFVISHSGRPLSYREMMRQPWFLHPATRNRFSKKAFVVAREICEYLRNINYYSASQFSDPTRSPVSLELEDDRPRIRGRRDAIDHEQFIYDVYRAWKGHSKAFSRYKNTVGPHGIGLVDDISFDEIQLPSNVVEVRAGGKTVKRRRTKLVIVPIFTIDGKTLSPNQLSEGTFKTMALLFYVLTDESRLLLVEEPEVCIHHGLLSSIITLIKNESRKKQIIISTHSDYVLDHLEPENVVLVERMPRRGTRARAINQALSKTDFKALKQYLADSGNLGDYWREGGFVDE